MNRYLKNITALLLAFVLLISCYIPSFADLSNSQINNLDGNTGTRDQVCTSLSSDAISYYATNGISYDTLSNDGAAAIESTLRSLMRNTHDYISSYDDCHYAAHKTDCENDNGKLSLIYTNHDATQGEWGQWNREHVWPKSLGGDNTSGGGADLHHIRPSDNRVNSCRSNLKYGEVTGGKSATGGNAASGILGGYYGGGYFEPLDNVKGDVARICLYVYVRWYTSWGAESITEVFQSVDVLLEWCEMDPVDTWEMGRNDVVEDIQGNRNVFIDYPEYAWLIFGRSVPENMTTPSGSTNPENNGTGGNPSHPHTFTSSVTVAATCTKSGVETFVCTCGYTYTKTITATGHSYTSSVTTQPTCTTTGVKTFVCTCGDSYTNSIAATGHSYTSSVTKEPTCTESGVKTFSCNCGYSYTQTITATGHSYTSSVTKDSTCTEEGVKTFSCSCGYSYTVAISMINHNYVDGTCSSCGAIDDGTTVTPPDPDESCKHLEVEVKFAVSATCQSEGYTGDTYCKYCGEKVAVGSTIPVTSTHNYSDWITADDGVTQYKYCLDCGLEQSFDINTVLGEIDDDAELILVLISLGIADKALIDELNQ